MSRFPQLESPIDRDEQQLALLALLLLSDVPRAVALWTQLAPPQWRGIINATIIDRAEDRRPPGFWFDLSRQRYGIGDRGLVTLPALTRARALVVEAAQRRTRAATLRLIEGTSGRDEWRDEMARNTRLLTLAYYILGRVAQALTEDELRSASAELDFQLDRLSRLDRQYADRAIEPDELLRRSELYPLAASLIYETGRTDSHVAAGFDLERNVLGISEHCRPDPARPGVPDCPSLTARGYVRIGTLPRIGRRVCAFNCKCSIGFARSEPQ